MTPKEKAEELISKYTTYAVMWAGGAEVEKQNAKQCALIAVDEIIYNFGILADGKSFYTSSNTITFYKEVKQEIEKL